MSSCPPKPARPPDPNDNPDFDDGDPYSCIAAGAAGVGKQTMLSRVRQCFETTKTEQFNELMKEDLASVKVALYDMWNSGRSHKGAAKAGSWAAEQMSKIGDSSLVDYDRAVPPNPL